MMGKFAVTLAAFTLLLALGQQLLDIRVLRREMQLPKIGIEQHRGAIGDLQHLRRQATQGGQPQARARIAT